MKVHIVLQILTLGLLILADQIDTLNLLGTNFSQSENICKTSWQNLETILKIPQITSDDYRYDIRKDICTDTPFACCTKSVEKILVDLAKEQHYDVLIRKNIANLKSKFIGYSSKFDRKFLSFLPL